MKKLMMYPGKYFCLMLGIFLFASCVPAFGQEMEQFRSPASIGKMRDARESFENHVKALQEIVNQNNAYYLFAGGSGEFVKMKENYDLLTSQEDNISSYTRSLKVADKEAAIDILVYNRYLAENSQQALVRVEDQIVFDRLQTLIEFNENEFRVVEYPQTLVSVIGEENVSGIKDCLKYFENRFNDEFYENITRNIERYNKEVYPKMTDLFRQSVKPGDVLETAFKQMSKEQQEALRAALMIRDVEVKPEEMAETLWRYIQDYGKGLRDPKYYSEGRILAQLKALPTAEKQIAHMDDLVQVSNSRGLKNFMSDYRKLTPAEQNVVSMSITKHMWGLAALAAIGTAAYIVDIAADNHFNAGYTMSNRELATIGKKIENGTANFKERFVFFRSPSTKKLVETDPVYTLSLVQLAHDIYAADELLKEAQKTQEQQTNDKVEQGVIKNIDKQIGTADFGVGTL